MSDQAVAIVTGSGSGIGRAAAVQMAEAGYAVVMVGRTESLLHQTAELVTARAGAEARTLVRPADVTDPDQVNELVNEVLQQFGRIDALINVAGYAALATIDQTTPDLWLQTIHTNLSSVVYLTRAVWGTFVEQRRGMVVNVSSMASKDPFPGFAAYAAAKAGVNLFTLMTAREGGPFGVRAVCIAPGAVETPMLRGLFDTHTIAADQTMAPEEIAVLIRDCVTGERHFEPGQTLFVQR